MKLDGLRVLDLSRFLPGPWISLTMADHGAEVIKIEGFEGEPTRRLGPPVKGFTTYFRNTQRGKLSMTLNLKSDEGREIFMRLAGQSDVIIDSFRPGVMDRLGLGYEAVKARSPRLVYCSLSAFGQTGPLAQRPSHDAGGQALTGVMSLGCAEGRPPSLPTLPAADIALGSVALSAILMALLKREKSGQGDYIDMAMVDTVMSWTPHILSSLVHDKRAPDLASERLYGGSAFYNIYRTSDGQHIVLSGSEMNFVRNLLTALGRDDLVELCAKPPGVAQAPVKQFLTEAFATKTRDEWDRWLSDKDVCYAPVLDLYEAWQSPELRQRDMIVEGPDGIENLGTPIKFREEPGAPKFEFPALGQHTDELLERIGYDAAARAKLHAAKVC
jgi:crotonobetainyl-CoA:carnitine CoA-transferase CaiB-like acyl-CoA transferase